MDEIVSALTDYERPNAMVVYAHLDRRQKALSRAWISFFATLAVIVMAFGMVGPDTWSGGSQDANVVGTFVLTADEQETLAETTRFVRSEYALRLHEDARAEVKLGTDFVNAFYRVERDRVMVETADAPGGNRAWAFRIDGDRLVQGNVVLHRARN